MLTLKSAGALSETPEQVVCFFVTWGGQTTPTSCTPLTVCFFIYQECVSMEAMRAELAEKIMGNYRVFLQTPHPLKKVV